jgi:hypothetical protein
MPESQPLHIADLEVEHLEIEPLSDEALEEVAGGLAATGEDGDSCCVQCCSCSACS